MEERETGVINDAGEWKRGEGAKIERRSFR